MPLLDALAVHRIRVMKRTVGHNMAEQLESRKYWGSAKSQLTQLFSNRTKPYAKSLAVFAGWIMSQIGITHLRTAPAPASLVPWMRKYVVVQLKHLMFI